MKEEQLVTPEQNPESKGRIPVSKKRGWKRWLNYQSVVKQVPFFLFLSFLAVLYIYNGHYADKTIRRINSLSKEVKELKYEYIAIKSKVLFQSRQSELIKAVAPLGLKEIVHAPVTLRDTVGKGL